MHSSQAVCENSISLMFILAIESSNEIVLLAPFPANIFSGPLGFSIGPMCCVKVSHFFLVPLINLNVDLSASFFFRLEYQREKCIIRERGTQNNINNFLGFFYIRIV